MYMRAHLCVHACVCGVCVYVRVSTCMCGCVCARVHACVGVWCVPVSTCMCGCVCAHEYMHVWVCGVCA